MEGGFYHCQSLRSRRRCTSYILLTVAKEKLGKFVFFFPPQHQQSCTNYFPSDYSRNKQRRTENKEDVLNMFSILIYVNEARIKPKYLSPMSFLWSHSSEQRSSCLCSTLMVSFMTFSDFFFNLT